MANTLSAKWAGMMPRERLMLGGGLVAAAAILAYTLAWEPWQAELGRLRATVPEKQQTLDWMSSQVAQIRQLKENAGSESRNSSLPLLTLVERSANQARIREVITRMNPGENADQVRIWMDDADFDRWLRWLEALNDSGIGVAEANIDRSDGNQVTIRTTLQR